ncbi:hypothetical protein [Spirochaeta cellobiosiphila]|uniref:hypothetical protein n=1 Tax=Spirochaeta cellobiosiphila TaxID=504483 RepID=UPI000407EA03|nr:hypothetical protein [Spirochaeta cellobiosiphila]
MQFKLYMLAITAVILLSSCASLLIPSTGISSSSANGKVVNTKELADTYSDLISIKWDDVAFEEDELLRIYDELGTTLGYYKKIENPNNDYDGAILYNKDQVEIFKLIPTIQGTSIIINIRSSEGIVSKMSVKSDVKPSFGKVIINYICQVSLEGYPNLELSASNVVNTSFGSLDVTGNTKYVFTNEGDLLFAKEVLLKSVNDIVNNSYSIQSHITNDPEIVSLLLISTNLISDITTGMGSGVSAPYNSPNTSNPAFNNDGSINNNGNPFDNF